MAYKDFVKDLMKINAGGITKAGIIAVGLIGGGAVLVAKKISDNINKNKYDENGYNGRGYDRNGYDKDGYNERGYSQYGYDKDGYDEQGYDCMGYNRLGYNRLGYNRIGYNEQGYDRSGYNRFGYDIEGYNKGGFNRDGKTFNDLVKIIEEADEHLKKANKELDGNRFNYSLMECRQGVEMLVKELVSHYFGRSYCYENLCSSINVCENKGLITSEESTKLHQARRHCNDAVHGNEEKTYNQVFFVCKVLEELIRKWSDIIGYGVN